VNITTRSQDFKTTNAIDRFARDHVRATLRHISEDILSVDVFLKDTNGPRGGVDKQALIRVHLRNRQVIALETTHENLYAAIKKGSKRVRRTVRRHLRKSRRIERRRMHDRLDDMGIPSPT